MEKAFLHFFTRMTLCYYRSHQRIYNACLTHYTRGVSDGVPYNTNKSKCVHFCNARARETTFEFSVGQNRLETVDSYKYLGIVFTYSGNFVNNVDNLAKAGGRALGSIISKIHNYKDFGFQSYEKVYQSCVLQILDYSSSVWGFKKFPSIDTIQNRALRFFMGWLPSQLRRWISMARFWNRVLSFEEDRLTRVAFDLDYSLHVNNWCSDMKHIFSQLNMEDTFRSKSKINLETYRRKITDMHSVNWSDSVQTV